MSGWGLQERASSLQSSEWKTSRTSSTSIIASNWTTSPLEADGRQDATPDRPVDRRAQGVLVVGGLDVAHGPEPEHPLRHVLEHLDHRLELDDVGVGDAAEVDAAITERLEGVPHPRPRFDALQGAEQIALTELVELRR